MEQIIRGKCVVSNRPGAALLHQPASAVSRSNFLRYTDNNAVGALACAAALAKTTQPE